jgi:hypothetical protein
MMLITITDHYLRGVEHSWIGAGIVLDVLGRGHTEETATHPQFPRIVINLS